MTIGYGSYEVDKMIWIIRQQRKQFKRSGAHRSGCLGARDGSLDAAGHIEADSWVAGKAIWTQRGAPK